VRKIIALFSLGWAVIYADRTVLYPMLPVIEQDFGLTGTQTGAVTSAYFAAYVAMQIPAGLLGDRFGLKKVLIATSVLAGLGVLAVGTLTSSYLSLLLCVAVYGVGAGAYHPMAFGVTMRTVPRKWRGISSAVINSGMSAGLILGLSLSGPVYLATSSWRLMFIILSCASIVVAILCAVIVRRVGKVERVTVLSRGPSEQHWDEDPSLSTAVRHVNRSRLGCNRLVSLLRNRNLVCIYVANFCSLYGFWTAVVWGPAFFQLERGIGIEAAGFYTAIVALGGVPAALVIGSLSDRLGRKKPSLVLFPLAAMALAVMAAVRSLPALVTGLIVYGLVGKLAWEPLAVAWTADHVFAFKPEAIGAGLALFGTIGMSSAIIAPLAAGWLRDGSGSLQGAFYLAAFLMLFGFLCLLVPKDVVAGVR
jgi:MFS family permease